MSRAKLNRLVKIAGYVFVILSLGFLAENLVGQFNEIRWADWQLTDVVVIIIATALYFLGLVLLALSWSVMLMQAGDGRSFLSAAAMVYSRAIVLKYLPGNVFHLVGRNFDKLADERGHWRIASATVFELILSLTVALIWALFVFSFFPGPLSPWTARLLLLGAVAVSLGVMFLPGIVASAKPWLPAAVQDVRLPANLPVAFGFSFSAFGFIMAAAFAAAAIVLPAEVDGQLAAGAFMLAWAFGFVVPGAPGGLGVREAAIVVGLSGYNSAGDAILFALTMRIISTLADLALFLCGRGVAVLYGREQKTTDVGMSE